jgi:hypothetical protein
MPTMALLDSKFVFKGLERTHEAEPDSQHRINVPDDCDLIPGKYLWSHERQCFVPVSDPLEREKARGQIDFVKAVYRALDAIDKGAALPKITKDWMADYRVSMDNKD